MKATCPACAKAVPARLGEPFSRHNMPDTRRRCAASSGLTVRKRHLVHPCGRCAALPEAEDADRLGLIQRERRPAEPRPLSPRSGPRSPLCETHQREKEKAQKATRRAADRVRSRGVTEEDRDTLWAAQGYGCGACGRGLTSTEKAPPLDHSHERARTHDHPEDQACRRCARGVLCDTCNRILIGRYSPTQLRAAAQYKETPTAQLLGWWEDEQEGSTCQEESPERSRA